jgi:hypothetical protein
MASAMMNERFRTEIIAALRAAATAHQNGDFAEIGTAYDRLSHHLEEFSAVDPDLRIAVDFLDGWYDSSSHNWQFYEPLGQDDWRRLSLSLAVSIEKGGPIDESVKELFTHPPRRGLGSRLRALFKGSA